jgi:hypothetical protein
MESPSLWLPEASDLGENSENLYRGGFVNVALIFFWSSQALRRTSLSNCRGGKHGPGRSEADIARAGADRAEPP